MDKKTKEQLIAENFDEANIDAVRAHIENDNPMASNNGKSYTMAIQPTGRVEVKISEKSRKICADMLLGDVPTDVKEFEQKGALKGEPEKVVRLAEPSVGIKANGKLPPIFVKKGDREIVDLDALFAHIEQPFETEE